MSTITSEAPVWNGAFFDGEWQHASAADDIVAPATGEVIGRAGAATIADLDATVEKAVSAQREWARRPYVERAAVLREAAALLRADRDRLVRWLVPESGSAQGKAQFETDLVISELDESAALASQPNGELLRSSKPRMSFARRLPVGIVGVISPFNFPAILSIRSVAPALALGNAVILKPDPRTPISGGFVFAELLAEAGLPAGLLCVLPGGAEIGGAIVDHPGIPCISFTGSTAAGRAVGARASAAMKKVHLELGGNNALLVLPDADPVRAASVGAWGSFLHQGQICMTTGRHLVPRSMVAEYTAALAASADRLPVGDPADGANALGPIIDERQRDKVHGFVEQAVTDGATVVAGGTYEGLFYRPTVLADVPVNSPAFTEEIFGPVAPIVAYDSLEEAIDLINSSEYGLSVSVLTAAPYAAIELTERITSGAVHINDATVDDEAVIPFAGVKSSGSGGHFGGRANLDSFTYLQWVTVQNDIAQYPF